MLLYLNLHETDREGVLVKAIVAEGRSYRPTLFGEAATVLRCALWRGGSSAEGQRVGVC